MEGETVIEIDGSHGEGGGQILRTALALSCVTGQPFRIAGIRKGREKPGLMPQHLMAVRAAARVSGARVTGDSPGSTDLVFAPGPVIPGEFQFDIGTAGSVTLVLQTLILPLLLASGRSTVILTGGTHVPFSPPYHYLAEVFAPLLARIGGKVHLAIDSYGFYPRGGGHVRCVVEPALSLAPLDMTSPGRDPRVSGLSVVANLPFAIAERQRRSALDTLSASGIRAEISLLDAPSPGKGTFLFLRRLAGELPSGFSALGALGKRAEAVGGEAAAELVRHHRSGASLDPHLADQVVPYLALAQGESSFTTSCVTRHLLTNLWVVGQFVAFRHRVEGEEGEVGRVTIGR
ncbi:RNA 3'-terminal phosphate cyclase [Geobacter sp.]|uniref:RNA 3'-terminal phosphate cyclase n=1 Tax=Geobacter sp. TaxID=46610 RepID=UPI00261B5308|nr:RNA 3'-terminal phosphate cyclase [Geobacter sp.]